MTLDRSRTLAAGAVVLGLLALPGAASATTYCTGGYNQDRPCDVTLPALQPALDAASLHAGADVVRLGFGDFTSPGFVYNDRGSAANGVTIEGTIYCEPHTACGASILKGAGSGAKQLSFTGGGGAPVTVSRLRVEVGTGAVGLELPAGARATTVEVEGTGDGLIGVRLAGAGAMLDHSVISVSHPGGPTDVGVEATAASIVDRNDLYADMGIRAEGPGLLQVTGGVLNTTTGIRASHARIAGAIIDASHGPAVEAVCADPAAADADVSVTNMTAYGTGAPGSVGARAVAADGAGQSCTASLDLNSSTITGVATSLLAHGEGAAAANIDASYSNFDPAKVVTEGPATVNTSSPGGNLNANPGFIDISITVPPTQPRPVGAVWSTLNWNSQLIDHGDPSALEPWQQGVLSVVHGRRDIGAYEYKFSPPIAFPGIDPAKIGPGAPVSFRGNAYDPDLGDPLTSTWRFDDGTTITQRGVTSVDNPVERTFEALGRHGATLTVVDATGRRTSGRAEVTVVRPEVVSLGFGRNRLRPGKRIRASCALDVPARVVFTIQRRARRHGKSLWKRVPGKRTVVAVQSYPDAWARLRVSSKWGKRRLRPGLFRLTATPAKGKAAHARFRRLP